MGCVGCRGWTTRLAGSDSVGHAYLFDILRSEMRFFPPPNFQSLPLSPFQFFYFSPSSMKLAANYGSWPPSRKYRYPRESLPRSKAVTAPSQPRRFEPRGSGSTRLIGRSFSSFFFFLKSCRILFLLLPFPPLPHAVARAVR